MSELGILNNDTEEQDDFQIQAKRAVALYINRCVEEKRNLSFIPILLSDIYIVWFSKTLQNWKALLSTTRPDGMYYELTYNGDKKELYLDAYKKIDNRVLLPAPTPGNEE